MAVGQTCACALDGVTRLWFEPRDGTDLGYFDLGNNSEVSVTVEENLKELENFTDRDGGVCASSSTIQTAGMEGTLYDICAANMNALGRGQTTSLAAGLVTAAPYVLYPSRGEPLVILRDETNVVGEVVEPAGGGAPYDEGTDYIWTYSGICALPGGGIPAPVDDVTPNVQLTYNGLATDTTEFYVDPVKAYRVWADGWNRFNSTPYYGLVHNFRPSVLSTLPLNSGGGDAASYPLAGRVLTDSTITGSALSKLFKLVKVTA